MYCSILVETGCFNIVTVGFLIIGHTHASIDQYFSCLRKKIKKASFIASPLALQHLFSIPPSAEEKSRSVFRNPISQIQLHFTHDYKAALAPYFNKAIKNYNIPYQFKFSLLLGKCICQTKMFSDPKLPWLPIMPGGVINSIEQILNARVIDIPNTHSLANEMGRLELNTYMKLPQTVDTSKNYCSNDINQLERVIAFNEFMPHLLEIESKAIEEQVLRHNDEAEGIDDAERYMGEEVLRNANVRTQLALQSLNTAKTGD